MPYILRAPTLITDFSATTGMTLTQGTGSVVLDTDATKRTVGSASLKISQLASAFSASVDLDCRNAAFGGTGSDGFSMSADNMVHLRSFIDTPNNQTTVSLFFSNDAAGFGNYFAATVAPAQTSSTASWANAMWDRGEGRADWTVGAGSPNWATTIKTIRIRPEANANGTLNTWLDALYRGGYAKPKILISFDDSNDQQYNIAKPVLDEVGLKATFFMIGDPVQRNVSGSLTEAMADTLYADGHDLAFHQWFNTYNNYGELTPYQLDWELDRWYEYAYRKGWTRACHHLAYPQGVSSEAIRAQLATRGMLTARTTLRLVQHHLFGLDNPYALRCHVWSSTDGTAGPISWMNTAVKYGASINIAFHQHHATVSTGAQISTADFRTIIRHAYRLHASNVADVVTHSQWYNGMG